MNKAETLKIRFDELQEWLCIAEVKRSQRELPKIDEDKITNKDWNDLFQWFKKFKEGPLRELRFAYNLHPPEIWEGFIVHEIEGLREQKILESAKKNFRRAWRSRHIILRKGRGQPQTKKKA